MDFVKTDAALSWSCPSNALEFFMFGKLLQLFVEGIFKDYNPTQQFKEEED